MQAPATPMSTPEAMPRNLRTAERFLVSPPLEGRFGQTEVLVNDLSVRGARFHHKSAVETGTKALLTIQLDGHRSPVKLQGVIVWTQLDPSSTRFVSGLRTYGQEDLVNGLLRELLRTNRSSRIEELRNADRFVLAPLVAAEFDGQRAAMEDVSARGARIQLDEDIEVGKMGPLLFRVPESTFSVEVSASVVWKRLRSIVDSSVNRYSAGLLIGERPELMRLAIGRLCEINRASLDTHSLQLKLKIMRARARQHASSIREANQSGVPAEQFLLVQGVREELRLNPEEAMYWYRKARFAIADPATRAAAPLIADHPDALAVWEYLDRSIDPSIIGRTFEWSNRR